MPSLLLVASWHDEGCMKLRSAIAGEFCTAGDVWGTNSRSSNFISIRQAAQPLQNLKHRDCSSRDTVFKSGVTGKAPQAVIMLSPDAGAAVEVKCGTGQRVWRRNCLRI
jgi:hypothetical protein